jgi:hypothetical protein
MKCARGYFQYTYGVIHVSKSLVYWLPMSQNGLYNMQYVPKWSHITGLGYMHFKINKCITVNSSFMFHVHLKFFLIIYVEICMTYWVLLYLYQKVIYISYVQKGHTMCKKVNVPKLPIFAMSVWS